MDVGPDENMEFDFTSPSVGENKNTKRKTETDMRIFSAYLVSLNEIRPIEALPPMELDRYLTTFFSVIKKHDGNEYEPASLRGMLCSVERYLRSRNYPSSVTRDAIFLNTRNMLKDKQKILREISKTQKRTKQELLTASTVQRLKQLYNAKEFGPYSPTAIINSLCFAFVIHLKIRKAVDHKQLLWGDIVLKRNGTNEYLCYEPLQGFDYIRPKLSGISQFRIYAQSTQDSSVDPIYIYKLYASKRPSTMMTSDSPFYLGIAVVCNSLPQQQQWFKPSPMGVNKLSDLVRMIRDITGSLSVANGEPFSMDNLNQSPDDRDNSTRDSLDNTKTSDDFENALDKPVEDSSEEEDQLTADGMTTIEDVDDTEECQTKAHEENTSLASSCNLAGSSYKDCSKLDHMKRTITEYLTSLEDADKSDLLLWLSNLQTTTDEAIKTEEGTDQKLNVTFSLTKSQLKSKSPFTVSANVYWHTRDTLSAERSTDSADQISHLVDNSYRAATDLTTNNDIVNENNTGISDIVPIGTTLSNNILRKRALSESVTRNTKYLKDRHATQPETRQDGDTQKSQQPLPVYQFEMPQEYASLYPPWPAVDPRLALFMRHGLLAGYRNFVNVENGTCVKKTTE